VAERDALINSRAMAALGTVMVLVLTGAIVFQLVRGTDPSPYTELMARGLLRRRPARAATDFMS
jgi:hypothetical protein